MGDDSMNNCDFYEKLLKKFRKVVEENDLLNEEVNINGRTLTPKEAIGTPVRQDYPIIKGKEKLIQAEFKGEKGQAFTDMPGEFSGTISEIINRPIKTNFDIAWPIGWARTGTTHAPRPRSSPRSPAPSTTPTSAAFSTATSSPRTSCSTPRASPTSPTSASQSGWARGATRPAPAPSWARPPTWRRSRPGGSVPRSPPPRTCTGWVPSSMRS